MNKDKPDEAEERLRRKEQYFIELDNATRSDDDEEDPGRAASLQAMRKAAARKQQLAKTKVQNSSTLPRSISDSNLVEDTTKSTEMRKPPQSLLPTSSDGGNKLPAALITRRTFSGIATSGKADVKAVSSTAIPAKTTGKRKREATTKTVPLSEQIFHCLNFYFFPNTDKNPARKMRITKAQEFGATWIKEFSEKDITHVVVDKSIDFNQMLKFLKKEGLPKQMVVVSENWPAECITFRRLVNPAQLEFKVKGYDVPSAGKRPESSGFGRSLAVKPAGEEFKSRRAETPDVETTPIVEVPRGRDGIRDLAQADIPCDKTPSTSKVASTAELDEAITQAQNLQHIPFDSEDESSSSRPSSSEGPSTDSEEHNTASNISKTKFKNPAWQERFQCMNPTASTSAPSPNANTIEILQQMATYYEQTGDHWRTRAYRQAIATLRRTDRHIRTKEEALALPQIGERLAAKIEEIAFTSRLRRLDNVTAEPDDKALKLFMGVYGAGIERARKWVAAGYTTLDEVLHKAEDLTSNQQIGIEHYADFHSRIPRAEVAQHGAIVRSRLQAIDPAFEVIVGGSYRRGADTSGDIDCIITCPSTRGGLGYLRQIVLERLVPELFAEGFLVASLAMTSRDDGSKWHGASCLPSAGDTINPNPWRRIDFLLVPEAEFGAALIYFTGDDIFNRSLRLLANKKKMRLNQRGLYKDVMRGKGGVKLNEGVLLEGRDEKKIFEILGVPWREPTERIC